MPHNFRLNSNDLIVGKGLKYGCKIWDLMNDIFIKSKINTDCRY